MSRFGFSPNIELSLKQRHESAYERRDRYRGELKITTRSVPEEERKRWYGVPPTKIEIKRRPDPFAF